MLDVTPVGKEAARRRSPGLEAVPNVDVILSNNVLENQIQKKSGRARAVHALLERPSVSNRDVCHDACTQLTAFHSSSSVRRRDMRARISPYCWLFMGSPRLYLESDCRRGAQSEVRIGGQERDRQWSSRLVRSMKRTTIALTRVGRLRVIGSGDVGFHGPRPCRQHDQRPDLVRRRALAPEVLVPEPADGRRLHREHVVERRSVQHLTGPYPERTAQPVVDRDSKSHLGPLDQRAGHIAIQDGPQEPFGRPAVQLHIGG